MIQGRINNRPHRISMTRKEVWRAATFGLSAVVVESIVPSRLFAGVRRAAVRLPSTTGSGSPLYVGCGYFSMIRGMIDPDLLIHSLFRWRCGFGSSRRWRWRGCLAVEDQLF